MSALPPNSIDNRNKDIRTLTFIYINKKYPSFVRNYFKEHFLPIIEKRYRIDENKSYDAFVETLYEIDNHFQARSQELIKNYGTIDITFGDELKKMGLIDESELIDEFYSEKLIDKAFNGLILGSSKNWIKFAFGNYIFSHQLNIPTSPKDIEFQNNFSKKMIEFYNECKRIYDDEFFGKRGDHSSTNLNILDARRSKGLATGNILKSLRERSKKY